MMHALYVMWYAKSTGGSEVTLNSEKIKSVVLVVIQLHLAEGISRTQVVS